MSKRNKEAAAALAAVVASAESREYVMGDGSRKSVTSLRDDAVVEKARTAGVTDAQILAAVFPTR